MAKHRLAMLQPSVRTLDTRIARDLPKVVDPFYLTPEWRALMVQLIRDRGRRCEKCGRTDCMIFGDHIVEIEDGGALLDPANVQLLCGRHHTLKTNEQRAKRMARKI